MFRVKIRMISCGDYYGYCCFDMVIDLCEVDGFMYFVVVGWFLLFMDINVEDNILERVVFLGIVFEGDICLLLGFFDLLVVIVVKVDDGNDIFCWFFFFDWFVVIWVNLLCILWLFCDDMMDVIVVVRV